MATPNGVELSPNPILFFLPALNGKIPHFSTLVNFKQPVLIFRLTKLTTHFLPLTKLLSPHLLKPETGFLTLFAFSFPQKPNSSIFVPCFEQGAPREG
jgi:hypothetical protein